MRNNPAKFADPYGLFIGGQTLPPTVFNPFDPNNWPTKQVFKATWEEAKKTKECKYFKCVAECELEVAIDRNFGDVVSYVSNCLTKIVDFLKLASCLAKLA